MLSTKALISAGFVAAATAGSLKDIKHVVLFMQVCDEKLTTTRLAEY